MIKIELPIKTVSEANSSEHWTKKAERHKYQQYLLNWGFRPYKNSIQLPCIVKLIRLSPRTLDDDNLRTAFKYVRDEISEILIPEKKKYYLSKQGRAVPIKGRADDDPRIKWEYDQEKCKIQAIRIEIQFDEIK